MSSLPPTAPPSPSGQGCSGSVHPQPGVIPGTALTLVQHLEPGLAELHVFPMDLFIEPVQVPLDVILSFRCIYITSQLNIICKFAERALNHFTYAINEDIK